MKLKLTSLLFFIVFGVYAQKQLQPYNYSVTEDGKTGTILIYASAEAVNSITFTLKNEKNETLKTKGDNDEEETHITFKVFPFTEVSFRKHLVDAINSIKEKDESNKEYGLFKNTLSPLNKTEEEIKKLSPDDKVIHQNKRKDAVQEIRNIYQFFDALVITAFEYDTEPVAGVLKYRIDSLIILKKTIQGLNSDFYFNKQAKFIWRHLINKERESSPFTNSNNYYLQLDNNFSINIQDYINNETDGFLKFLRDNDGVILKELYEFNQNSRKGLWNKAKPKFKTYAIKKLKEAYNLYELKRIKDNVVKNYFQTIDEIEGLKASISKLKSSIDKDSIELHSLKVKIDSLTQKKIKLINQFDNILKDKGLELQKTELNYLKAELSYYDSELKDQNNSNSIRIKEYNIKFDSIQKIVNKKQKQYDESYENKTYQITREQRLINFFLNDFKKTKTTIENSIASYNEELNNNLHQLNKSTEKRFNLILKNKEVIKQFPVWVAKALEIELDFNDGFLEHIKVVGKIIRPNYNEDVDKDLKQFFDDPLVKEVLNEIFGEELVFQNDFPFGFSSKSDFADLYNYSLFQSEGKEKTFSLPVTNIIKYIQRHQNDRLDFSPKDQLVRLPLDDPNNEKQVELKKETSSKILNAKIFTDFNGLQESEPNGLVQIEVEKQIPIWTKRIPLGIGRGSNYGLLNYAVFNLTWAKLNEEDRELQVSKTDRFVNNQTQTDRFVTYLNLIEFENISVGGDLNLASFDFPLLKTRLELNGGLHYGRIRVIDDIPTTDAEGVESTSTSRILEEDINMIRFYPDVILRVRPEERFGGYFRYRPFRTIVPNTDEDFFAVSSGEDFIEDRTLSNDWLQRFELGAFFTPSADSDNKFFFRYRYTNNFEMDTNGYSEIQVGYQIFLRF